MASKVPQIPDEKIRQCYAGDDWAFSFRYGVRANPGDPIVPTDLSGWTITSEWRPKKVEATTFLTFAVDMSQAADGIITIRADETITRAMKGPGVFDIQGVFGQLDKTFCWGKTKWQLDATRG